jgi:hypothetical protein
MGRFVKRENLGEALHVALRKCCDSKATSAAYNCISLMPGSVWGKFLDGLYGRFKGTASMKLALTKARRSDTVWVYLEALCKSSRNNEWELNDAGRVKLLRSLPEREVAGKGIEQVLSERDRWWTLLVCIFHTFDDNDWQDFATYLYEG